MRTNRDRAKDFARLLNQMDDADDPSTALTDLLANALHYCNQTSIDFEDCLRIADDHFGEECFEGAKGAEYEKAHTKRTRRNRG